ncbi:MAG TPA: DNA translocase FtsK, partial [Microvirga sp.]|nr:DNA translocase FtsK [Microvirga sp.]
MKPIQVNEPAWRQAFIAADGVRFTRTPDRVLQERSGRLRPEPAGPVAVARPVAPETARPAPAERARVVTEAEIEDEWTLAESAWADLIGEARIEEPAPEAAVEDLEKPAEAGDEPVCAQDQSPAEEACIEALPVPANDVNLPDIAPSLSSPALAAHNATFVRPDLYRIEGWPEEEPAPAEEAFAEAATATADAEEVPAPALGVDLSDVADAGYLFLYDAGAAAPVRVASEPDACEAAEPEDVAIEILPPLARERAPTRSARVQAGYELPHLEFLAEPVATEAPVVAEDILEETAGRLERVIRDFGVKGEVIHVHPGPVVTLYELEPAPGTKSSRVISLADDIARSMSAVSARVAVVQGRNAIG